MTEETVESSQSSHGQRSSLLIAQMLRNRKQVVLIQNNVLCKNTVLSTSESESLHVVSDFTVNPVGGQMRHHSLTHFDGGNIFTNSQDLSSSVRNRNQTLGRRGRSGVGSSCNCRSPPRKNQQQCSTMDQLVFDDANRIRPFVCNLL